MTYSAPVGTDAVVESKRSGLLWDVLHGVYTRLGPRNTTGGDSISAPSSKSGGVFSKRIFQENDGESSPSVKVAARAGPLGDS